MNAMPNLQVICNKVADAYKKIYGDKLRAVYLYGSYARGDFDEESDIDFAAIVEGKRMDLQNKRHQLWDYTNDVDLDYDVLISPRVIPANEFDKYFPELPYYQNILKEGKKIA